MVEGLGSAISRADNVFPRILLGLVLVEFFADQQQWGMSPEFVNIMPNDMYLDFQKAKKAYLKTAKVPYKYDQEDLDRGFVVTGLWSYSRHPNFAAEQAVWVALYQWSCFAGGALINWTIVGAIGYLILFQASTWFTELITTKKYPEYEEYQSRVPKFLPQISSGRLPGDFSDKKAKPKVEKAGGTATGRKTKANKK